MCDCSPYKNVWPVRAGFIPFCFGLLGDFHPDSSLAPHPPTPGPGPPTSQPPNPQDPTLQELPLPRTGRVGGGGPRKPASPLKNKEEGANLGTQAWRDVSAGEGKLRTLHQLCCLSSWPRLPPPWGPSACRTRAPLPQAQMLSLSRWRWPGRGGRPRHPYTHHGQRSHSQAHRDRGLLATQSSPPQTLRNPGHPPGGWPLPLISAGGATAGENRAAGTMGLRF